MHPEAARTYLQVLLEYQFDLLRMRAEPWGLNYAEFLFRQTAVTVFEHPEIRGWFLELVRGAVFGIEPHSARLLPEFVLYFAHISRWPELAAMANQVRDQPADPWAENPAITWSSELTQALSDAWPDREFYPGLLVHNVT